MFETVNVSAGCNPTSQGKSGSGAWHLRVSRHLQQFFTPSLAAVFTTSLAAVKTTQKQSPAAVKPTSWDPLGWGRNKVEMVTHVKRG